MAEDIHLLVACQALDSRGGYSYVTVTKPAASDATRACRWCGRPIEVQGTTGRPRLYCKRSCRQRDFESRQRSAELGLSESELVVTRQALEEMHDALYVLEAAIEDVERDLESARTAKDYREAIDWLLQAARPLVERRLT